MDNSGLKTWDEATLLGPDAKRSPEMEAVWSWIVAQDTGLPNWLTLPPDAARLQHDAAAARWNVDAPAVETIEPVSVPGSQDVPCRLIEPADALPGCILFLHGGGWAFGNLDTHDRFMRRLAIASRCRVLGVEYRLAPEHPHPAPLQDSRAAWQWLEAMQATDPRFQGSLAIAGDSAGANLAMGVMLGAIGRGARLPDQALLFYGAYEAGVQSPSYERFAEGYGLTRAAMARFWDFYVADMAIRADPTISTLRATDDMLRQLPPLFVNAAGLDPLLSDSLALVERLSHVGVRHTFRLHPGVHHGFMQMSRKLPEASVAIDAAAAFFRSIADTIA